MKEGDECYGEPCECCENRDPTVKKTAVCVRHRKPTWLCDICHDAGFGFVYFNADGDIANLARAIAALGHMLRNEIKGSR
jgi:hypothetical protein